MKIYPKRKISFLSTIIICLKPYLSSISCQFVVLYTPPPANVQNLPQIRGDKRSNRGSLEASRWSPFMLMCKICLKYEGTRDPTAGLWKQADEARLWQWSQKLLFVKIPIRKLISSYPALKSEDDDDVSDWKLKLFVMRPFTFSFVMEHSCINFSLLGVFDVNIQHRHCTKMDIRMRPVWWSYNIQQALAQILWRCLKNMKKKQALSPRGQSEHFKRHFKSPYIVSGHRLNVTQGVTSPFIPFTSSVWTYGPSFA